MRNSLLLLLALASSSAMASGPIVTLNAITPHTEGAQAEIVPIPVDRHGEPQPWAAWPTMDAKDVVVVQRSVIAPPAKARKLEGNNICKVEAFINHRGEARDAVAWDCPEVLHATAERSVETWLWEPPADLSRGDGVRVRYELRFRL